MNLADHYGDYLASLITGARASCAALVREALHAGVPVKTIYSDLFRRSLYNVGDMWQSNRISVATEHLATAITEGVMSREVAPALFRHEPTGRSIIVSCVANEFHQVGGRMVADVAEMKGWDSYFLGANTSLSDLLMLIGERRPDVLALSTAVDFNLPALRQTIEAVRERHPELPIWLGGQMFRWGGRELAETYPGVTVFSSLDEFDAELDVFPSSTLRT